MTLSEAAVAAAVTVSIAGVSYAALNTDALTARAETVASAATCRTVDAAIVAYVAEHGTAPARISQLRSYVKGDISAYRISKGVAAGPGC
ncbi:hypothetical protein [Symbioplanes lichenis]|uniref:hypothetical protein n=1 Tax=Symbioplanes lichenis TaxID=1629072 RepID=UPI002739868A|nr:hypothetical protein [Actinoplanes lichenis]